MLKLRVFEILEATDMDLPALIARIPAGEPMELVSEIEWVDMNYLLTKGAPDALILRVDGESMCPEIADGDWLVVSRGLAPQINDICVCSVNGKHTLKRLKRKDVNGRNGLYLVPSNGMLEPKEITPDTDFKVLAVVTRIIHSTR